MSDWAHRCRHPCITRWYSSKVEDVQFGSAGDAFQADLRNRRLLIHYPQNERWRQLIAPRVVESILDQGSLTTALVFGDAAFFGAPCLFGGQISVVRLATTTRDKRVRPDRHQQFGSEDRAVAGADRKWGIWWLSKTAPLSGTGTPWVEVRRCIQHLEGAVPAGALLTLAETDVTIRKARQAAIRTQARWRAAAQIAAATQGVSLAQNASARHEARNWLRTVVTQEYIRRNGEEDSSDLVTVVMEHFPEPQWYFGRDRERPANSPPDLGLKAGSGIMEWAAHFRAGSQCAQLCLGTRLPDLRLLKATMGTPHLVWWSSHLVQEQVCSIRLDERSRLLGEYLLQMRGDLP
jgi:hypothetical protein